MRRFLPALVLFPLFILGCSTNNKSGGIFDGNGLERKLDSIGQHFIDTRKVKGISIAVGTPDDTLYNKGFGYTDSLETTQVNNDHVFLLASISKLVGATMVMKLAEEGKLSLDDTLLELLPDFPNPEQAKKITLRQMLSHTSGLLDYAMDIDPIYLETGRHPSKSDYYNFFQTHELFFEPGEFYSYSNSGFVLMAMIVERVTGQTFQHEVDRIINEPTGLDLQLTAGRIEDPYFSNYFELVDDSILVNREHWTWIKGDGGLTTTAVGLSRFPFFWRDGTVITKASFERMIEPTILNSGVHTGYGIGVRTGNFEGERVIGHTGGHKSTYAMMMYFPEKELSIVIMVNTDNTPADAVTIIGPVALAVLNKETPVPAKIEVPNPDLSRYTGTYLLHEYKNSSFDTLVAYVNSEDGHLYMKRKNSKSDGLKYYYVGDHAFTYDRYPMDRTIFELDESGNVIGFRNYWNGLFQRMGFHETLFKKDED